MVLLVTLILSGFAVFYIANPLLVTGTAEIPESNAEDEPADIDAIYMTLNELEFDRRMGKLSEEDYRRLSEHYRRSAAEYLKDNERTLMADRGTESRKPLVILDPDRNDKFERIRRKVEREIQERVEERKRSGEDNGA